MRPGTRVGIQALAVVIALVLAVAGACGGNNSATDPLGTAASSVPQSSSIHGRSSPRWDASPAPGESPAGGSGTPQGSPASRHFPGGLLIADRLNGRLLVVDDAGSILWRFPVADSLPSGETFSADDAFMAADGKTIVANEESNQIVVRIDIATQKVIWEYGTFGVRGSGPNQLWTPDDAYPLANGDVSIADIKNCRIIEVSADKQIVHQFGTPGVCAHNPPTTFGHPNGDTPLPDGGVLVTEIDGSHVIRLSTTGDILFDIKAPVQYPSDAQLLADGNVLVVDYANPGAFVVVNPLTQQEVYRYGPRSGDGRLDHPSLAIPLPDGTYALNDDHRDRVVVVDPTTNSIVWSYGHADQASSADGYLNYPDGIDLVPPGIFN